MNIAILGSTGSIGRNALDVIKQLKNHRVYALTAKDNIDLLYRQILSFQPAIVCVNNGQSAEYLYRKLKNSAEHVCILYGTDGLKTIASHPDVQMVLIALVGAAGLLPLLSAIKSRKKIALANKESLVMAGDLVMKQVHLHKVSLIPVDSEHSAIFQCIQGAEKKHIHRIILTASGGALYAKQTPFKRVRVADALKHPNWKMGKKITIDSATLMNKGFEAIEAHHLFGIPIDTVQVLIHPQSIVHSLVEYIDGSVLAQLSNPDMRLPIQYALTYPERRVCPVRFLKLEEIQHLEFFKPNVKRFICLTLAYQAVRIGGTMPAVLNAADEVAVEAFLNKRITFDKISYLVKKVMRKHTPQTADTIDTILAADQWARKETQKFI